MNNYFLYFFLKTSNFSVFASRRSSFKIPFLSFTTSYIYMINIIFYKFFIFFIFKIIYIYDIVTKLQLN